MTTPVRVVRAGRILAAAAASPLGPSEVEIGTDGRIARVGPVAADRLSTAERRRLLMPALADAHDHGRGLRPLAFGVSDRPLETWIPDLARQPRVSPYLNAAVAFARVAESGVGAVNHCHNTQDGSALLAEAEAVSRAARDVGIRVAFAWPFFDRNAMAYGPLGSVLSRLPEAWRSQHAAPAYRSCAENMALMAQASAFEHDCFRLQYHPVAPQWAQPETLTAIAGASADTGRPVHIHLLETERQRQWADGAFPTGGGLLGYLDAIGLLSPRLTVAHAVWLRPYECDLLARRGVTVSINLSSNLRLRSGMPPVEALRRAGARIAFGLDGMSLDDDEDMLRELRLAHLAFARGQDGTAGLCRADVLDGAWRIGRHSILGADAGGGEIAVGAPADLVAIDHGALAADCVADPPDPATLLLGRAQARHVSDLFVGGRQIVADGRCRSVDRERLEAELTAEARAAHRAAPPDLARIAAVRDAVDAFYRDGCHCRGDRPVEPGR